MSVVVLLAALVAWLVMENTFLAMSILMIYQLIILILGGF